MAARTGTGGTRRRRLPGEAAPLEYEAGRGPVTRDEALGVARRHARDQIERNPRATRMEVPDDLPAADAPKSHYIFRLRAEDVAFARARAEMEGRDLTSVVADAVAAYGRGTPKAPRRRSR